MGLDCQGDFGLSGGLDHTSVELIRTHCAGIYIVCVRMPYRLNPIPIVRDATSARAIARDRIVQLSIFAVREKKFLRAIFLPLLVIMVAPRALCDLHFNNQITASRAQSHAR